MPPPSTAAPARGGQPLGWERYATRWAGLHGGVDPRLGSGPSRAWFRIGYGAARVLARLRVRPSTVTATGVLVCLAVPILASWHGIWPAAAAILVVLAGFADTVDGAVAIVTNRVTRLGYVYDSVADRLAEACWLVALWVIGTPGWLVALIGGLTWLHEYVRARATAAGMTEIGATTIAERPTRTVIVVVALLLAGLSGLITGDLPAGTVTVVMAGWLLLGAIGLVQLMVAVHTAFSRA